MPKLTKSVVESAPAGEKQSTVWCSELKGFGVYVYPTGQRTYFVDYRSGDGARRRMTIGRHGVLTCEEARKLAIATLGEVVRGEDPALERMTRRKSLTLAELCERYIKAVEQGLVTGRGDRPKKPAAIEVEKGRIKRHIVPLLGRRLVIDLVAPDISRFIKDVTLGKTAVVEKTEKKRGKAIVRGGAGTAGRTAALLGGILSYAIDEHIISDNPCRNVKLPAIGVRKRRLDSTEFAKLEQALVKRSGHDAWQGQIALRLLALTGCRLGEIINLKWAEVDLDHQEFNLVDSKTGPSLRPIGKPVVDILRRLERAKTSAFVLPRLRDPDRPFGNVETIVEKTFAEAGLLGVTSHTLRHSFGSVGNDLGFTELTVAAMLGHATNTTTGRYIHHLDTVLIAAADKVSMEIHRQMMGAQPGRKPTSGRSPKSAKTAPTPATFATTATV